MDFAELQAARLELARLTLYTNEVMTENHGLYTHLGYREIQRLTEAGYRHIYLEKVLGPAPTVHLR
jgi:hypothetical protein